MRVNRGEVYKWELLLNPSTTADISWRKGEDIAWVGLVQLELPAGAEGRENVISHCIDLDFKEADIDSLIDVLKEVKEKVKEAEQANDN